ncbi:Aste57867_1011 [Aphanomyces stellatus]|uniref:HECT-type E3 ubiquitin transferase n=1 Tax=Aphanomyces stellatus TaxID=120398 RepID=A0A485K442_9STRA|nr:hypothetical protein As57867_001010 [Aphanomyces stellatus]VFT78233.1 Aste57867_1011 [Aphanomyces stellatus]
MPRVVLWLFAMAHLAEATSGVELVLVGAYGLIMVFLIACGIWSLVQHHRPSAPSVSMLPGVREVTDLMTEDTLKSMWTCDVCAFDNALDCPMCLLCGSPHMTPTTHPYGPVTTPSKMDAARHRRDWTRGLSASGRVVWQPTLSDPMADAAYVGQLAASPTHAAGRVICQSVRAWNASSSAAAALALPEVAGIQTLPFPLKHQWWLRQLASIKGGYTHRLVHVRTARHPDLAFTTCKRLLHMSTSDLRAPLSVRFEGEPGIDAGGLEREWFTVVAQALFDPTQPFFDQVDAETKAIAINANLDPKWYRAIGRFVGRALYDGHPIPARLNIVLFKHLLGIPFSLDDVKFVHSEIHRSLTWILAATNPDTVAALELDFSVLERTPDGGVCVVDLLPHGREIPVTATNKVEYVAQYVQWICVTRVGASLAALVRGLHDVLPASLLSLWDHKELELLLCGTETIDVADWKKHTYVVATKSGAANARAVVAWFWAILGSLSQAQLATLLQFVTGSFCVPLQGFQALTNRDGSICHFTLRIVSTEDSMYPVAHTCSNRLDLPNYDSQAMLREALEMIASIDVTGFSEAVSVVARRGEWCRSMWKADMADGGEHEARVADMEERQPSKLDMAAPEGKTIQSNDADDDDDVEYDVTFNESTIGLTMEAARDHSAVRVKKTAGPARRCGRIETGDTLLRVNDQCILGLAFGLVMQQLKSAPRPLVLHFRRAVHVQLPAAALGTLERQLSSSSSENDDSPCATSSILAEGSTTTTPELEVPFWKSMDWTFGLAPSPQKRATSAMEDFRTAMLSLNIQPPEASHASGTDKAALWVRWMPCPGAATYQLQVSRDWPVNVWKACAEPVDVRDGRLECLVKGLEHGRAYVFRVRCGLHATGPFGDFSDTSVAVVTEPPSSCVVDVVKPAAPSLDYAPDFDSNVNTHSLVVTWHDRVPARAYQVQHMKSGHGLLGRGTSPELSAAEVREKDGCLRYRLQGLTSATEYVVRVRVADASMQWGDWSDTSPPLATMPTDQDEANAQDANARIAAAIAVVSSVKTMAHSMKDAMLPKDSDILSHVLNKCRGATSPRAPSNAPNESAPVE